MTWGILAFFILVAVSIVASLVWYASQPAGTFRPFFQFGWLGGLFFIFIAFWLVKGLFWPWRWHYARRYWRYGDDAYYIVRERYAKGEITKEQFEQMMRDLQQDRGQSAN
jgi:putative membrane protein